MREKVESFLAEINPMIQADGGEISLVSVTADGIVTIRIKGSCPTCPSFMMPLTKGVERLLMEQIPAVKKVIAV